MKKFLLPQVLVLALFAPYASHGEVFRAGYPVCESRQKLQEFLSHSTSKEEDDKKGFEYVVTKKWCVYPAAQKIQVRSMSADGVAQIFFTATAIEAWAPVRAIGRREQPPSRNVIIEDPDHPDGASVCAIISQNTRVPSAKTRAIAQGVASTNLAALAEASPAYRRALQEDTYELVTDWRAGRCVAELDVPGQHLVACSIDYLKYWQCRHGEKSEVDACYQNLCAASAPASEAQ
jgi:hypothetical protein